MVYFRTKLYVKTADFTIKTIIILKYLNNKSGSQQSSDTRPLCAHHVQSIYCLVSDHDALCQENAGILKQGPET